jgi:hypothetical protein
MTAIHSIDSFFSQYDENIFRRALKLRDVVLKNLPLVEEQLDIPARMVAYSYGKKYDDLVCVIIPSKKGLKLGFNRGVELPDPDKMLEGTGKLSRYVVIGSDELVFSKKIKQLLQSALSAYKKRSVGKK